MSVTVKGFIADPKSMKSIEFTAGATLSRGDVKKVEDTYGLVFEDMVSGDVGNIIYACDKMYIDKATGAAINAGDKLYLNTSTSKVSATNAGTDLLVGVALKTAASADTTVLIHFDTKFSKKSNVYLKSYLKDVSTAGSAFTVSPVAGNIIKIYTVIDGALAAANAGITFEINGTLITGSAITLTQAGSAAGDIDISTPTGHNTLAVGDALEVITDGLSTNTVALDVLYIVEA